LFIPDPGSLLFTLPTWIRIRNTDKQIYVQPCPHQSCWGTHPGPQPQN
jgi:hypothetical protein